MGYTAGVILVPLAMSVPTLAVSIVLVITSVLLTLSILLHKGRGSGMSDLFGGGMSTSMGGSSMAERMLDRITIAISLIWAAAIISLLVFYKFGI